MNLYQNEIIDHAIKSEANLRVALLTGLSFPELRKRLIDEFVVELSKKLNVSEWICLDKNALANNEWLKFRKKDWPENIFIGFSRYARENFSSHYFVVIAHDAVVNEELRREISLHLQGISPGGKDNYCAWRTTLDRPYGNLNSVDGLLAISESRRRDTVDDLAHRIEQVGNALDELFQKQ